MGGGNLNLLFSAEAWCGGLGDVLEGLLEDGFSEREL